MRFVLIPLCAILAFVFLQRESQKQYVTAVILKGLASLCFMFLGLLNSSGTKVAERIVWGLLVGCIADVLLNLRMVFPKKGQLIFLIGILVFLSGHVLYLTAVFPMCQGKAVSVIAAVILTALLMVWIFCQITAKPAFKIFGVVYLGAIMLLNCVAADTLMAMPSAFSAIFFAGSVLFLVSDIVLILNTFGSEFRQSLRNINIGLYYAGQLLLSMSLLVL